MIRHYVTIFYPGVLVSETVEREVKSRDKRPKLGRAGYAWRFFDRTVMVKDGEELLGRKKNFSDTFYIGKEYSDKEIKEKFPHEKILIDNVECNNLKRLVETKTGNILPLGKNDKVVAE